MNVRQLRNFLRLAEIGGFSATAEQVGITQSALSRQIAALEVELGVALFRRRRPGLELTPAGELLRRRAQNLVDQLNGVTDELLAAESKPSGTVALGAHPDFANLVFPRLAERMAARYPDIHLHLVEAMTHMLEDLLTAGTLDVAIVGSQEPRRNIALEPLCVESVYLISATDHAPELPDPCTLAQAAPLPLILSSAWARERTDLERSAAERGISLNVAYDVDGFSLMKRLARRGLGHLVRPYSAICDAADPADWRLVRLEGIEVARMIAHRGDRAPSPAASAVIDCIRTEVAERMAAGEIR